MNILMLGGTGAIGSSLLQILIKRGDEIYITSRYNHDNTVSNVYYLRGNAKNKKFVEQIMAERHYDVIIDFMVYNVNEFSERYMKFLSETKQYVFFSSCRVYSENDGVISEENKRLLDVCNDKEYLETEEYALTKARQENLLISSGKNNWTILRPYITYNSERLQLGVYEKEHWLYRALKGRTILFSKDIASHITTLTFGGDVALAVSKVISNKYALGEAINITSSQNVTWEEVLYIYVESIERVTGIKPKILFVDNSKRIARVLRNQYQIKYDRVYDRYFDNTKVKEICGDTLKYVELNNGLENSLNKFINKKAPFKPIYWKLEALADKLSGEITPLSEISSIKDKIKYLIFRFTPYV